MRQFLRLILAVSIFLSCGSPKEEVNSRIKSLPSVDLKFVLQGLDNYPKASLDLITGYHLELLALEGSVETKATIDNLDFFNGQRLSLTIHQLTDYEFKIGLGKFEEGNQELSEIYLTNIVSNEGQKISKEDLHKESSLDLIVDLQLTDAGKKVGFANSADALPNNNSNKQHQNPDQNQNQNNNDSQQDSNSDEDNGENTIPNDKNLDLTDSSGTTKKLFDDFNGDYMLIDLSSSSCSACVAFAESHNQDSKFQAMMDGKKCTFKSLIPERELPLWQAKIGNMSFMGKNSFGISIPQTEVGRIFGTQVDYIPFLFLIDKNGKIVDSQVGDLPASTNKLCGNGENKNDEENNGGGG